MYMYIYDYIVTNIIVLYCIVKPSLVDTYMYLYVDL